MDADTLFAPRLPLPLAYADPAFKRCLDEAISTPELVQQFDRLYGATLMTRTTPLERAIDRATGKADDDMRAFVKFVHDCFYMRLPDEAIVGLRVQAHSTTPLAISAASRRSSCATRALAQASV